MAEKKDNADNVDNQPKSSPIKEQKAKVVRKQRIELMEHPTNPAKIKVSKEDFFCHLGGVASIMVIYFISILYSSKNKFEMKPSIFSDIENDIQTKLKKKEIVYVEPPLPENPIIRLSNNDESYNNGMGCTLYASDSSLSHNTGLGIFTMKAIKAGDVAIPPTQKIKYQNIQVSPYLMMMKQHASLDNVIGGLDGTNIVATRDIEAGEEIFFKLQDYHNDFQSVYQVLHPNDPTMKTFEKVDVLTQQMLDSIPMRTVEVKPKKRYKQKKKRKTITKPVLDATMIFELFKDTIEGYDKTLASLLPKTHSEAQSLIDSGGKALYLSNKRSTSWLSKNSVCIDALNSNSNESKDGAFASRKISQGEVIISSPLIVMKKDDSFKHCLASSSESMLCPLTILSYNINDGVSASQCKSDDTNECPSNVVNARVDASSLNHSNSNMETIMTRIDNAKDTVTSFTVDIIAIRDIAKDEEIFIDMNVLSNK